MTYLAFKQASHARLRKHRCGLTWPELKAALNLPYARPCPEWVARLEREIGLVRRKKPGIRPWVWQIASAK